MDTAWEHCLADYLRSLEVRSKATRVSYGGILKRFLSTYEPQDVTRRQVEDFMHGPSTRDRSAAVATMNARLSAIGGFYRFASVYIPEGATEPLWTRALPTIGVTRGKPERSYNVLSFEEFERFFACIPDSPLGARDRSIFTFFFWTGRRRAEVQRLKWKDIQQSSSVASGYIYRFRGKGKQHFDDSMELPKPAVDALFFYLESSGRLATIKPEDPLWVAIGHPESGGNVKKGEMRALAQKGIVNRLKLYAAQAGIEQMSLHSFRHFASKTRLEAGMDIVELRDYLRHSSLDQTYHYARGLMGTSDPFAKRLEAKFARFSKP